MPLGPGQASSGRGPARRFPRPSWPSRPGAVWRLALPLGLLLLVSAHLAQRSLQQERSIRPPAGLIR
ncbi:hypothetical protein [Synechococcus sp. Ace-Pa]|nr:hypothetical protein [Synechococcus sp. Ace-Pa]